MNKMKILKHKNFLHNLFDMELSFFEFMFGILAIVGFGTLILPKSIQLYLGIIMIIIGLYGQWREYELKKEK
jgi:hypothetical protein